MSRANDKAATNEEIFGVMLNFGREFLAQAAAPSVDEVLEGFSIEVMPRTAAKIESFRAQLPAGTCVYIAQIGGTRIEDMVATARRVRDEGFPVMPHFPARLIHNRETLRDWIARYQGEAGVDQALLLGGGTARPEGDFRSSIQLIETELFDKAGFKRLHVAGHPEGNREIDPDASTTNVDAALHWKQDFSHRTDAAMAVVTQFAFDAKAVLTWTTRLRNIGVTLPVHVGIAGPAKLQTLIKHAMACGVGAAPKRSTT